jgi:SH3 domain-containing protein
MAFTPTQKELHDLCDRNEFISKEEMASFMKRLEAEGNAYSFKFALEKFLLIDCPKCRASGAFKWHFLGKLSHPDCGRSWFVGPGEYIVAQLKAVFRTGGEIAGSAISDAEKKGESGFAGMIFGFLMGVMIRLPFAIMMIPIQAVVSLCQSNKDNDGVEYKAPIKLQSELPQTDTQSLDVVTPPTTESLPVTATQNFTYTMTTFLVRCEMATDPKYPNEEYLEYLAPFGSIEFESPVEIWSVNAELTIPSKNRICNVYCYDKSIDDMNPDAPFPTPIGRLQLTLWSDKGPEIQTYFTDAKTKTVLATNAVMSEAKSSDNNFSQVYAQADSSSSSKGRFVVIGLIIALIIGASIYAFNGNKSATRVATACVGKECNLRSSPSKGKNVIRTIPKGGSVAVIEHTGEWAKVRYADSEGYIKSNLLK